MVWLESAPSRLVTTVEVVAEPVSPSKTTTPGGPAASGAYTITRCPAVTRSPGLRISRAFSGMLLTKVPFLLRSEEHTSELQSLRHLVCRLLLEKKKKKKTNMYGDMIPTRRCLAPYMCSIA